MTTKTTTRAAVATGALLVTAGSALASTAFAYEGSFRNYGDGQMLCDGQETTRAGERRGRRAGGRVWADCRTAPV